MFKGLFFSLVLHLILLLLMIFGVPILFKQDLNTDYAVVTEIVNISELTNIKVKKVESKEEPKKPNVAKEPNKSKPELSKPVETAEDAEKLPDKLIKEKKLDKKVEEKKVDKKEESFDNVILKSLDAKKKPDTKKIDKDFNDLTKTLSGETNKDFNPDLPLSMSEIDALKSQIKNNWNTATFSGASDAKGLQVTLLIELDIEGNVINVQAENSSIKSPYYQVFVESTKRAIKKSSPLKHLSKDKYHTWKQIKFRFDSSGMIY